MSRQRIITGHVLDVLAELPDASVHMIVTSPPYYGLRAYGTEPQTWPDGWVGELGQEPTVDAYITHLVDVFRAARRVLRLDGTLWLNIGDSYCGSGYGNHTVNGPAWQEAAGLDRRKDRQQALKRANADAGLKAKDLMLVPERLALALQADGWWIRSRIIWAKTSAMPESATDRPTNNHEHIWLLTRSARYFYDAEAVREEAIWADDSRAGTGRIAYDGKRKGQAGTGQEAFVSINPAGRNQRNVWHLGPENFPEAHFATFPPELPRRAILAGTSERGVCPACSAPWVRITSRGVEQRHVEGSSIDRYGTGEAGVHRKIGGQYQKWLDANPKQTTGWAPSCACDASEPVPATVLDLFVGSGTSLLVAGKLDRDGIGIDLKPDYAQMSVRRVQNGWPLFTAVELT